MQNNHLWKVAGKRTLQIENFLVMGILNITPDSFYDGGSYDSRNLAIARAKSLISQGADIIDIGGESTRPFSERVQLREEKDRVLPVLKNIQGEFSRPLLSVDTYKADMAKGALECGASIINDVTFCKIDPGLKEVLSDYQPGYILMHSQKRPEDMQKDPQYQNVVREILEFFENGLRELTNAGLAEENIVLDPGIGFGKTLEHNLSILGNAEKFLDLGRPLCMGLSNKSMWQKLLGLAPEERKNATQVASALLSEKGIFIHRVHEVDLTRQTLEVVKSFQNFQKQI